MERSLLTFSLFVFFGLLISNYWSAPSPIPKKEEIVSLKDDNGEFISHAILIQDGMVATIRAEPEDHLYVKDELYNLQFLAEGNLAIYSNAIKDLPYINPSDEENIKWISDLGDESRLTIVTTTLKRSMQERSPGIVFSSDGDRNYIIGTTTNSGFHHLNKELESAPRDEVFYVIETPYQQVVFSNIGGAISEVNLPIGEQIMPTSLDKIIAESYPQNNLFPLNDYFEMDDNAMVLRSPKEGGYTPILKRSITYDDSKYHLPPMLYATLLGHSVKYELKDISKDSITFVANYKGRKIEKQYRCIDTPYIIHLSIKSEDLDLPLSLGILESDPSSKGLPTLYGKTKDGYLSTPSNSQDYSWVSLSDGFFTSMIAGDNFSIETTDIEVPSRLSILGQNRSSSSLSIKGSSDYYLYYGPNSDHIFGVINKDLDGKFSDVQGNNGWFNRLFSPFSNLLFWVLTFFHSITNSWGIAIIATTLVSRIALYPLNKWSFQSNMKMQEILPKQKEIQDRFKNDQQGLHRELAMLYKNEGVNPFSGCLPVLLQFPFLIGMFELLRSNFALRGASFIPGWIDDLTTPDILFSWQTSLPIIGNQLHILPIILGICMLVQQAVNSIQQKKQFLSDQQKQMQFMGYLISIILVFVFYNMPSGLNIYWIFSTIFGTIQQLVLVYWMKRR